MSIVGLDLSGVETRPTGFCKLKDMKAETCLIFTDKEILKKTGYANSQMVAVDALLCLPPGRKSIERKRQGTPQNGHKTHFANSVSC